MPPFIRISLVAFTLCFLPFGDLRRTQEGVKHARPKLQISRVVNGANIPHPELFLYAQAGENLTLSCNLSSADTTITDANLTWSNNTRKHPPVIKQEINRAVISFGSVRHDDDWDIYSCVSQKYNLSDLVLLQIRKESYTSVSKRKFTCMFGERISSEYVCDGIKDCIDGSDESFTTCERLDVCTFKRKCNNGRCIPNEWCCNHFLEDTSCKAREQPSCCTEIYDSWLKNFKIPEYEVPKRPRPSYEITTYTTRREVSWTKISLSFFIVMMAILKCVFIAHRSGRAESRPALLEEVPECTPVVIITAVARPVVETVVNERQQDSMREHLLDEDKADAPPDYKDVVHEEPPPSYANLQDVPKRN